MKTEWRATDSRWWPLWVLLSVVLASVPLIFEVVLEDQPLWTLVAFPAAAVLQIVGAARSRLRLTDEGVEVRRLSTRLYRWSDIASVERAPEWDGKKAIWLRLRGSVATSAPEVLVPPGPGDRRTDGQTLDAIVSLVRRRAGLDLQDPAR